MEMRKKYEKQCKYCNIKMDLKQLNDELAVYVCADESCKFHEFPEPKTKWTVVKRSLEEFYELLEEENQKKESARQPVDKGIAEIEQLVADVFTENFECCNDINEILIDSCEVNDWVSNEIQTSADRLIVEIKRCKNEKLKENSYSSTSTNY